MGLMVLAIAMVPLAAIVPLALWARSLRGRSAPRVAIAIAYAALALGVVITLLGAVAAERPLITALAGANTPVDRARALAEGISEAMNCSALAVILSIAAALWLLFIARRHRPTPP